MKPYDRYDRWEVDDAEFRGYVRATLENLQERLHTIETNHERRIRILERAWWGVLGVAVVVSPVATYMMIHYVGG